MKHLLCLNVILIILVAVMASLNAQSLSVGSRAIAAATTWRNLSVEWETTAKRFEALSGRWKDIATNGRCL